MSNSVRHFYDFGPFRLDLANRLLLRDGEPLPLTPKAVETLLVLIQHGGEMVKKDELMKLVWPDSVVEEGNLTQNIYLLRKTLSEGSNGRDYIQTIPRRGYRFVGAVRESPDEDTDLILSERTRIQVVIEEQEETGDDAATVTWSDMKTARLGDDGALSSQLAISLSARPPIPLAPSFQHPRALSIPVLLGAALIVAIAALLYLAKSEGPATKGRIESMAVLPFKPLVEGSGDEQLGVGMADALITQLSNIRQLIVRPTNAVLKYGSSTQDLVSAGRELNVDAVLDCRFQRADGRLRVTVQLISVRGGVPVWADKFDEQFTGMLAVQDAIAQRVTQALALKLTSNEQKLLTKRFTEDPEAYQAYIEGRSSWSKGTTPDLEEAIRHFEQALRFDPDYALAYAGLADAYATLGFRYDTEERSQSDSFPKAKAAAIKALQLNDLLAEAHTALAVVKARYDWDFPGAESEVRRAIELNPNYAHAHHMYSLCLSAMGRPEEATAELRHAQELNPLSSAISKGFGDILDRAREYDQALEQYRRTLRMDPNDPMVSTLRRTMGWTYEHHGMHEQAVSEFIESLRLQGVKSESLAELRQAYDTAGMKGYWNKWLELRQERIKGGRLSPFYLAQVYAFLGRKDEAFACLQKACEERSVAIPAFRFSRTFDDLRADPRYKILMARMGLGSVVRP